MYKWHERKEAYPDGQVSVVYLLREDAGPIFCHIGLYHAVRMPCVDRLLDEAERIALESGLSVLSWRSQMLGS